MSGCWNTTSLITSVIGVAFVLIIGFHDYWINYVAYGNYQTGEANKGKNVLEYMETYFRNQSK